MSHIVGHLVKNKLSYGVRPSAHKLLTVCGDQYSIDYARGKTKCYEWILDTV